MKKLISMLIALCVLMTSSLAFASPAKGNKWKDYNIKELRAQLKKYHKDKNKRDELISLIVSYYKQNGKDKDKDDEDEGEDSGLYFVNGEEIDCSNTPVIKYKKIIIPVKPITKGLGAQLTYNEKTHIVTVTKGNTKIVINLEKKTITVNGTEITPNVLTNQKRNAVVLVKFIAETLGHKVDADDDVIVIEDGDVVSVNDNTLGAGLNQFEYAGSWTYESESGPYKGDYHWSAAANAYFLVKFNGTEIKLYGSRTPFGGIAAISIDGSTEKKVDFYASKRSDNKLLYSSNALPNGQHILKVRVTGTKNSNSSNYYVIADRVDILGVTVSTNDTQAPTVPQELKAEAVSESQIRLSWKASSDNVRVSGYKVYRNGTQIATVTNGTSYTDTGLTAITPYVYSVASYDPAGNSSAQSAPAVGITLSSPISNVALSKAASSDSELTSYGYNASKAVDGNTSTRWSAADGSASHWLKVDLGSNYNLTGTEVTWEFDKTVYKYMVEVSKDNINWTLKVDKTGNTSTAQTQKNTFTADSVRYVRITVTELSVNTWASISEFKVFGSPIISDTQAPAAPTGLTASAESHDKVKLAWTPVTDNVGVLGYKIYRNGVQIAVVASTVSYTDTGLSPETVYAYTIAAFDAAGNTSPFSSAAVVITPSRTASDIALNKAAYSDSVLTGYGVSKANDGSLSTIWYAKDGNPDHWWKVDLGGVYNLTGTEITWPLKDRVYKYIVEVSSDNINWTVKVDKTSNTSSVQVQKDAFTANSVRYVRVRITGLEQGCWAGITEFKALGFQQP